MNVIVQTGLGLWWSKLGKSQALVTVITLAMFFIIYFTCDCDKETAVVVAAVAIASVFVAVVAIAFAFAAVAIAFAAAFVAFAAVVAEEIHLSKKTVIFSYAAEFIVILVPMLITILR